MGKMKSKIANETDQNPEELVQAFAACSNFPKDRAGILALAQSLKRASGDFHIDMDEIIRECCDISAWCPSPHEIRSVALGMRESKRNTKADNRYADWERMYGPPQPDWPLALIGVLEGEREPEKIKALHIRAIRDMLFYTEGDGLHAGDRKFWEEDARAVDLKFFPELVNQVREIGGWKTERELQAAWETIQERMQ